MALKFTMRLLIFASFCCFLLKTAYGCAADADCGDNSLCVDTVCLCDLGYFVSSTLCDGDCTTKQGTCTSPEVCTSASACSTDCAALACENGGTCKTTGEGTSARKCHCTVGYAGTSCDECASDVGCNSKGACNTGTGACTCTDTTNYGGTYCEECKTDVACNSKGTCASGACTCTDATNYGGLFCDECKTDAGCSSKGTCDATEGTCTCDSSNVGTFCQHACPAECPTSCTLKADGTGAECSVQDSGAVMVMTSLATIVMAVLGPFL